MKKLRCYITSVYCYVIKQDYRLYILLSFLFLSLFFSFTVYSGCIELFIGAIEDLCTSLLNWFCFCYSEIFKILFNIDLPNINVTVLKLPNIVFENLLDVDLIGFAARLQRSFDAFPYMLSEYNDWLYNVMFYGWLFLSNLLIFFVLLLFLCYRLIMTPNGRPAGYVSKPTKLYFKFIEKIFLPVKNYIKNFLLFASEHSFLSVSIIIVWLINVNLFTILIEFFAFYYYFICSWDFASISIIAFYFILHIVVTLSSLPFFYWLFVGARIYYRVCENIGLDNLKHMEAMNCGYLKSLDVVCLIVGEPGTGKTTLLVDMFLSWINIFKQESLNTILKYELYFPSFPWASFREDVLKRISHGEFKCLPELEDYIDLLMDFYNITADNGFIYGYRDDLFITTVNIGHIEITLPEALKEYGKAFMLYMNVNLGISNLPIRMDGNFDDSDYFKIWNGNFFEKKTTSRLTHILNQDMLRHGVKMDPKSKEIGTLGPSVIGWTEISKDLGNQLTNQGYKSESLVCNPKNEKSTHSFMFARHVKSLIDNFPYIRFITDDQRASNVAASALGLMCVVNIRGKSEKKVAMPGQALYLELSGFVSKIFDKISLKRDNLRGDVTLSWLLFKQLESSFTMPAQRINNCFGYEELTLLRQAGNAFSGNEGAQNAVNKAEEHIYFKLYWKNYSGRFISDSHASPYGEAQKRAAFGINDIPCYKNLRMSDEEIVYHRSRLGAELINMKASNDSVED